MQINLNTAVKFESRHNGPTEAEIAAMLEKIGASSLTELINQTVPESIQLERPLQLPAAQLESEFLKNFKKLASKNKVFNSFIGLGYYDTLVPGVILRNVLENPGWYTAYTPYQAEIAQGRLEALINFQTVVIELTGMELANASLLDEGTAAAEAMTMLHAVKPRDKKNANTYFVDEKVFPQTKALLITRAEPIGIKLVFGPLASLDLTDPELYGAMFQYPNVDGEIVDYTALVAAAKENKVLTAFASDLLALTLLTPPGEMGADVVVGSAQRFGVPMGYGGPHSAFFATKEEFKRQIPGRIIGVSIDRAGNKAYRMALQTREQHIKREKATSNICTAQVLLAVMSSFYAVYHGPEGLKNIALRTHGLAKLTAQGLAKLGFTLGTSAYFDTIKAQVDAATQSKVKALAVAAQVNFRYEEGAIIIAFDEAKTIADAELVLSLFANAKGQDSPFTSEMANSLHLEWPTALVRTSSYLTHPVFNTNHSEHEMLRYIKKLESKDLSLVHSMISLGSCTMKLNATAEMIPVTWPEFGQIHPFAPIDQTEGYQELFTNLRTWLTEITGFADTSLQPNSGAQGEYAGLMVIRAYHLHRGEGHRNVALIPTSAHGTNPASAVMAGMRVVLVGCDEKGNIDVADLKARAEEHASELSCLMVTYPSTHGVFEEAIQEICATIHSYGGQVYMDGANMNAQVGVTSPGRIGADVCHLNLHKTFCIPHGGGGPGMGPICVAAHLAPFLPGNPLVKTGGEHPVSSISSAPYGSASILPISYAYISMMGGDGLTRATQMAILNANYIKERLSGYYPLLYTGSKGRAAHEMIVDCRAFKEVGVEVEDIAKRLMDYGYHAPTVSFPVAGTLMIEPTESETKAELDKFCDAMLAIRAEIQEIEDGKADRVENVLKNAPHTATMVLTGSWDLPYSREKAVFPAPFVKENKFWPSVRRIDSAYGDRNLICSCIPVEEYAN
ncbi:MAG: aminomethyl-transferring glycine dehydrogenase [Algoriphagus sp.]|jgi:glycine dehydrogenase|uniref:aminomethyl-transferring glycine dehydrogenase n=3 Tax=Algoriphagus sp. TaxID=1872435 RepID=UPI00274720C0|nr:aminomethyl-transferring glycine dehydrogenase [Algoriphagus sp.]MDP4746942.1 aminomethyl-transferring glycine dehydrogenase [Algoriphagus sp.]MDP4839804.1 aminomethyl-transferring glycine dehydrogenase [Algoriphagus sp.]MDP4956248.1 aminomethyl-transferring glycine dehydrogenase [Algoriphagus sp.]MDP5126371.1 aminomethyl-transferring glycine dehydrogenase [Algoriphagus sp.]